MAVRVAGSAGQSALSAISRLPTVVHRGCRHRRSIPADRQAGRRVAAPGRNRGDRLLRARDGGGTDQRRPSDADDRGLNELPARIGPAGVIRGRGCCCSHRWLRPVAPRRYRIGRQCGSAARGSPCLVVRWPSSVASCSVSSFQSSPGPGAGCCGRDARDHDRHTCGFNPHPARGPGAACRGRSQSRSRSCCFNPHPARGPGAADSSAMIGRAASTFQSSPGPGAGCCRWNAFRAYATRLAFQSSPGPGAGCCLERRRW